jgi:anti-sigma B factor antagonist
MHADEPTRLDVSTSSDGSRAVVTLEGEIDPHTTTVLDQAVDTAADQASTIVLDLGGVSFIDSAGLRSLIRAQRVASEAGGGLVLRNLRPSTERILDITGLNAELTIE